MPRITGRDPVDAFNAMWRAARDPAATFTVECQGTLGLLWRIDWPMGAQAAECSQWVRDRLSGKP